MYAFVCLSAGCFGSSERHEEIINSPPCRTAQVETPLQWSSAPDDNNVIAAGSYLELRDTLWILGEAAGSAVVRFPLAGGESTLLDKKGNGPGEWKFVDFARLHPSVDTLLIFHNGRISYITSSLQEARSFPSPVKSPVGMAVLPGGAVIIVDPSKGRATDSIAYALHEITPVGTRIKSYRIADSAFAGGTWPLALSRDPNTIWLVEPRSDGFVVEQWDVLQTARLRQFRITPRWWVSETKRPEDYERLAARKEPVPKLPTGTVGFWDSGDALWVALRHFAPSTPGTISPTMNLTRCSTAYLLALDRTSGSILGCSVFDDFLFGFTNTGRLVMYTEDATGHPRISLANPRLKRPQRTARPTHQAGHADFPAHRGASCIPFSFLVSG